jgi:hypothetical protein
MDDPPLPVKMRASINQVAKEGKILTTVYHIFSCLWRFAGEQGRAISRKKPLEKQKYILYDI